MLKVLISECGFLDKVRTGSLFFLPLFTPVYWDYTQGEAQMVGEDLVPVPVEELAEEEEGHRGLAPRLLAPDLDELPAIDSIGSVHVAENLLGSTPAIVTHVASIQHSNSTWNFCVVYIFVGIFPAEKIGITSNG